MIARNASFFMVYTSGISVISFIFRYERTVCLFHKDDINTGVGRVLDQNDRGTGFCGGGVRRYGEGKASHICSSDVGDHACVLSIKEGCAGIVVTKSGFAAFNLVDIFRRHFVLIDVDIINDIACAVFHCNFAGAFRCGRVGRHNKVIAASGITDCGIAVGIGGCTACGECQIAAGIAGCQAFGRNAALIDVDVIDGVARAVLDSNFAGAGRSGRVGFHDEEISASGFTDLFIGIYGF